MSVTSIYNEYGEFRAWNRVDGFDVDMFRRINIHLMLIGFCC